MIQHRARPPIPFWNQVSFFRLGSSAPSAPPETPKVEPDTEPATPDPPPKEKPDLDPFNPTWPTGRPEPQPKA